MERYNRDLWHLDPRFWKIRIFIKIVFNGPKNRVLHEGVNMLPSGFYVSEVRLGTQLPRT